MFSSRRARASKEFPLLELFVDFFERGFALVLALLQRLLGDVPGGERLSDNLFDRFSAFGYGFSLRIAAGLRQQAGGEQQEH